MEWKKTEKTKRKNKERIFYVGEREKACREEFWEKWKRKKSEEKKITLKEEEQKTHDNPPSLFHFLSSIMPTKHTYKLQHPLMTVFIETSRSLIAILFMEKQRQTPYQIAFHNVFLHLSMSLSESATTFIIHLPNHFQSP
jgi:hypothetical protein